MTVAPATVGSAVAAPSLGRWQLAWLAAAVFAVSAGYGAFLPVLSVWLEALMPGESATTIARHVGMLSGAYAAGLVLGAPLWGWASDHAGRGRILIVGLVGYVASLMALLAPDLAGLWGIYAMRGAAGFFAAAVLAVVPALVAARTPARQRARRFAWLSGMSLVGFLFGPGLIALASLIAGWSSADEATPSALTEIVIVLSAMLGAFTMVGLAATLPAPASSDRPNEFARVGLRVSNVAILWWLGGTVMFVVAGFELGIVLQGQQHAGLAPRDVAMMFALCSLVMLLVNALLFFTSLLDKAPPRLLACAGLLMAIIGLIVLGQHGSEPWIYLGIGMTGAGNGLILPVVAFLAAGAARETLGATMGGLAAATGLGQVLGSAAGGWLFGAVGQQTFNWLIVPLGLMFVLLVARPGWALPTAAVTQCSRPPELDVPPQQGDRCA